MMPFQTRRHALQSFAAMGSLLVGGCLGSPQDYPGSLEISNDHNQAHSGTIAVQKVSDDEERARSAQAPTPPTPTTTPIWGRERTFDVPEGRGTTDREFLTESGSYYIEVELDAGATDTTWLGLYRDAAGGVAEEKLSVSIQADRQLVVSTPTAE